MPVPIIDPSEPPRVRARRKLACLAHRALAELIAELVEADGQPVSASAACRASGLRVVVRLVKFSGPAWEPIAAAQAGPRLTAQQRQIVGLCNRETPTTAKRIARALGKRDVSSYLREQLRRLVRGGLLRRGGGGYLIT